MKNHRVTRIVVVLVVLQSLFFGIVPANVAGQSRPSVRKTPESTQPAAVAQTENESPFEIAAQGVPPLPAIGGKRDNKLFESDAEQRREWFRFQRSYPFSDIPAKARENAFTQAESLSSAPMLETWQPIGPRPTTSLYNTSVGIVSGRINAIAASPANSQLILIGSSTGGIWRSTDGGTNWSPVSDDQVAVGVGSINFAPSNPNVVYAGMGGASSNGDYLGSGVLKSTNAGATWTPMTSAGLPLQGITSNITVDTTNENKVYLSLRRRRAANQPQSVEGGLYIFDGMSWSGALTGGNATDFAIHPTNSQTLYSAFQNGLYLSIDGGANWSPTPIVTVTNAASVKVAVTPASPDNVYLYFGNNGGSTLMTSPNSGATWSNLGQPRINASTPVDTGQFSNNCYLKVAPNNANVIYIGNRDLFRSTDGGANWSNMTTIWYWDTAQTPPAWNYAPPVTDTAKTHSDQQTLTFAPADNNVAYIGHDGGITKVSNLAATPIFESLNENLSLTQFIGYTIHPTDAVRSYGGSQDNGTQRRLNGSASWKEFDGGDGGMPVLNPTNPSQVFANYPLGTIGRYTQHGTSTETIVSPVWGDRVAFYAPLVTNGVDDTLYFGTTRVRATNINTSPILWYSLGGNVDLTTGGTDVLSAIGVQRSGYSTTQTIYTGSALGRVMVSQSGGQTWTDRTAGLPTRFVKSITVKAGDANTAYVTFSGFSAGNNTGHVYRTTDAGANWTDISGTAGSGGLSDIPVNSLLIDPTDLNKIYVGTDIGVYRTTVGGTTWEAFTNGIPPAIVNAIVSTSNGATIQAATYGRGAYQLNNGDLFQITHPNTASVSWSEGSAQTVTWHIGANAATNVNILLSADGGQTYPHVLASGVANDGTEQIYVPDVGPTGTTLARIKAETVDNVSSDVSDVNFTITDAPVFNINGRITAEFGEPLANATVTASNYAGYVRIVKTDVNGDYIFTAVPADSNYTITPNKDPYIFGPKQHTTGTLTASVTRNFIARWSRQIQWTQLSQVIAIQVGNPQNIQRNNDWNNPYNWNCTCIPGQYDRVTVNDFQRTYQPPGGNPLITYTPQPPTLNGVERSANSIYLNGSSIGGGILNLGNDVPGDSKLRRGSIDVLVKINSGEFDWLGGQSSGGITVAPTSSLNFVGANDKSLWYSPIINNGTVNWSNDGDGTGRIVLTGDAARINNNSVFNAAGDGVLTTITNGGDFYPGVVNSGTLNKTAGAGTLTITDNGRISFTNNNNATINVASGKLRSVHSMTFRNGTSIAGDGVVLMEGGGLSLNGSLSVTGNFEWRGGTVRPDAPSSLTSVGNRTRWTAGHLDGANPLTINTGSHLNIEGASDKSIGSYGVMIDNLGTINWSNAGGTTGKIVLTGDGSIVNGGTFNAASDGVIFTHGLGITSPKFSNFGTLSKTAGTGSLELTDHGYVSLTNNASGIINVAAGTLRLHATKTFRNGSSITGDGRVLMDGGTLIMTGNTSVAGNLEMAGGEFRPELPSSLTGTGNRIRWTGGNINAGSATLTIPVGSQFNIEGVNDKTINSYGVMFNNQGTVNWSNGGSGGRVLLSGDGSFVNNGTINAASDGVLFGVVCCGDIYPKLTNNGTLSKTSGNGTLAITDNGRLATTNFGTVGATSGILSTTQGLTLKNGGRIAGNGQFLINGGTTILEGETTIDSNVDNFILATGGNLHGANPGGGTLLGANGGRLVWTGGAMRGGITLGPTGFMKVLGALDDKVFDSASVNNNGTIAWQEGNITLANNTTINNLSGATFNAPAQGGFVFGGFYAYSSWFNNSGTVNIGQTSGIFGINDGRLTFTNQASGTLNIDVGGANAGTGFDQIDGGGTMALGGTLRVNLLNNYQPASGTLFPIINHSGRTGAFDNVQIINNGVPRGFTVRYLAGNVSLRAYAPSAPPVINTPLPENWFKADALAGVTNSPVPTWADASGKLNDATQTDAARQPKLVTNAMNGKPVVRFDGANDQMPFDRSIENDFTITAVFQSKRGIGNTTDWWASAGIVDGEVGGVTNDFGLALNVDGRIIAGTGNPETMAFTNPSFNDGRPHIVTFTRQKSNGELKVYVDGVLLDTKVGSTATLNAPPRLMIGSRQTDGNFLDGDIAEIITYGSLLSDVDRTAINNYLATKYISTAPQTVWNAAADFLPNRNPAFAWSYGYIQSGTFNLFTNRQANEANVGIDRWNNPALGEPSVRGNLTGNLVDYYGLVRQAADELNVHPQNNIPGIVRWTAPAAGAYLVQGRFDGDDYSSAGTTSDAKLNHNADTLLAAPINGFGTTFSFSRIVTVAQNDTIDFIVGMGANNNPNNDSTGLAATITKAPLSISGRVTRATAGTGLGGVTVNLKQNNSVIAVATTDAGGGYAFASNLTAGANYVIEPLISDYTFSPVNTAITNFSGNQTADFAATQIAFFAEEDFSITNNPNGAWSYGWTATRGAPFTVFPNTGSNADVDWWSQNGIDSLSVARRKSRLPVGMLALHPGPSGQNPVVRWTAPSSGTFRVLGRFEGADYNGPQTSTDVAVLQNSLTLTSGNVNGGGSQVPFDLTLTVNAGDKIDFSLGFGVNGWYAYDSTNLMATVRPVSTPATANTISGTLTGNDGIAPVPGAILSLFKDGRLYSNAVTNAVGQYSLLNLETNGNYIVSAAKTGIIFKPASRSFLKIAGANTADFTTGTPTSTASQCVVPPANIVSWYRGEDNPDDRTGGNNGTIESGVTFVDGKAGRAFDFNGTGGVALGNPANLKITNALTVSAWIKPRPMGDNTYGAILGKWNNVIAGDSYLLFLYKRPGGGIELAAGLGRPQDGDPGYYANVIAPGAEIKPDEWTHVAVVYNAADGTNIGYVNGIEVGRRTRLNGITDSDTPIFIGRRNAGGSTIPFNGAIDETAVFNRVLTAGDIRSITDADASGQCSGTSANTPQGSNVNAGTLYGDVNYTNVTTAGTTTFTIVDPGQTQGAPNNYRFDPAFPAFDIATTAVFAGSLTQCFRVPGVSNAALFSRLRVLHFESPAWIDRTLSREFPTRTICSSTSSFSPFAVAEQLVPTASNISLGGRVFTTNGRGIRNARISIISSDGAVRRTFTSSLGYYRFDNVPAGENYVLSVSSKTFTFSSPTRIVFAADDISDADFVSNE